MCAAAALLCLEVPSCEVSLVKVRAKNFSLFRYVLNPGVTKPRGQKGQKSPLIT